MPRKKWSATGFSQRLVELRKKRGITQVQLAQAIGSSQRAICYYETEAKYPPAPVVIQLAEVLGVTTDELLGMKPLEESPLSISSDERRVWKKFRQVLELPERDQKAVMRLISSLARSQDSESEDEEPRRVGSMR